MKIKNNERGSVMVFIVIVMVVLLVFAGLAVDVSHWMVTRNDLQNAADAAALAGARKLGHLYEGMTYAQQLGFFYDRPWSEVFDVARDTALKNQSDKTPLDLRNEDLFVGEWHSETRQLEVVSYRPHAVRVVIRRDSTLNGPVATWFARIVGMNEVNIVADATASLLGLKSAENKDVLPVGLSEYRFTTPFCDDSIVLYPSNDPKACGGWHVYENFPASESFLRKDILQQWLAGSPPTGTSNEGDLFNFTGGTLGNQTYVAFYNLWNYMKSNDGGLDPEAWEAYVPVYASTDCSNPNPGGGVDKGIPIKAFARIKITNVFFPSGGEKDLTESNKSITAVIDCGFTEKGPSGGAVYGLTGSIPKLVE